MQVNKVFKEFIRLNKAGDVAPELRERLFGFVMWVTAGLMLLGFAFWGLMSDVPMIQREFQIAGVLLLALVWLLWKRKRVDLAALILVTEFWALITMAVIIEGGLASYWLVPQVLLVLFARLILNGRIAILFGLLTAAIDFAAYHYQLKQYLPADLQALVPRNDWGAVLLGFLSVLFIFYLADTILLETLRKTSLSEGRYRSLFDKTNDVIFLVGLDRNIVNANPQAANLLGYQIEELVGKPYVEIVAPEEAGKVAENFERLKTLGISPLFERILVRKDGSRCKVEFNVALVRDEFDQPLHYQGVGRDVTERKRLEDQLRYSLEEMEALAMQDPLTGLLNRRAISEHAEAEWHRAQREKRAICLVLIDLDNLKEVNDTLGHLMGDQVILELSKVINGARRRYDWAGRWGGDEFMLVLPGANLVEAQDVAERLKNLYGESPLISGLEESIRPHVSLGVACYSGRPGEESSLNQLIAQADRALYRAKEGGRNRVEVYRD